VAQLCSTLLQWQVTTQENHLVSEAQGMAKSLKRNSSTEYTHLMVEAEAQQTKTVAATELGEKVPW
jgi:hypothetical protein